MNCGSLSTFRAAIVSILLSPVPCMRSHKIKACEGEGREAEPRITGGEHDPKTCSQESWLHLFPVHTSPHSLVRTAGDEIPTEASRPLASRKAVVRPSTQTYAQHSCLHVHRLHINCIFTPEKWDPQVENSWNTGLADCEMAGPELKPMRKSGNGGELRDSLLGREVGSSVNSPRGRSGPPEDVPGKPGAAVHTQLSAVLPGLRPSSPLGAL